MKKIQSAIKICGLALFTSMLLANATSAWGPEDRPTYTNKSPAPYATFNSITDNAAVGDERYFVRVGEVGSNEPYKDSIKVVPGKEYEVYIYYHNDAASNTNASGLGVATDVKVASTYPSVISKGTRGTITGNITWSYVDSLNASPKRGEVWDEAFLDTDYENVIMRYKPGTAILHNSGAVDGSQLTSDIFNPGGVMIGHVGLNGIIPGCAEYSGYVTYTLTADVDASTVSKKVSLDGENWAEKVNAKPGQYVTYRVEFNNTGTTKLTNVIFKDSHDDGLFLVAGSTTFFDVDHTDGLKIDDILDISGYNTGDSYPGGRKWINYQFKIADDESLCGKTLKNTISVRYNSEDQKSDDASVYVYCEDTPPPPDCETDPTTEGCTPPSPETPEDPGTPDELPNTGPLEIIMAILVVAGICGGGYYFYRSRKNLNKVEKKAKGKKSPKEQSEAELKPEGENIAETTETTETKPTDEIKK